jgi:hypothetical protein
MSVPVPSRFLRHVLIADAASCVASALVQLMFTGPLAELLRLPAALLTGTGAFLLAYGAVVAWIASRDPLPRPLVWMLVAGNAAWAAACAALLAGGWVTPSSWGVAWILAQAATVAVLAQLQWTGLRRTRVAGWA